MSGNQAHRQLGKHTFRMTPYPQAGLLTAEEEPSHKIEMKIHLQRDITSMLPKLQVELDRDNMSVYKPDGNNDIVISGIPLDTAFALNAESIIMRKVKKFDNGARVVTLAVLG